MKLTVDIPDELIAQKIIWFLSHLKNEGVKFKQDENVYFNYTQIQYKKHRLSF